MPLIRPGGGALGWAAAAAARRHGHLGRFQRFYSARVSDPLRILFCGSDAFSCESLRALDKVRRSEPQLVKSIDVVTRPPKRTGRGLKVIRHGELLSKRRAQRRAKKKVCSTFLTVVLKCFEHSPDRNAGYGPAATRAPVGQFSRVGGEFCQKWHLKTTSCESLSDHICSRDTP